MWSRNKANLYIRDALDDFHYDPKALPSPIAQRKIYRNKLMLTHLVGFGSGVGAVATGTSYLFNGTTDTLNTSDHADWNFGTGNFTIDLWAYFNSSGNGQQGICSQYESSDDWMQVIRRSEGYLQFWNTNGGVVKAYSRSTEDTVGIGSWVHVAVVRNGTSILFFINGDNQTVNEVTAVSTNDLGDKTADLCIGRGYDSDEYMSAYLDEIRISKGLARWTTDFTPSVVEYSSDANTQLLIHGDETIISGTTGSGATFTDSGNTGHTVTENGNAIRDTSIFKIPTI